MRGAIAAALILLSGGNPGHVEGAEKDRWESDQVYLGGTHGHLGRHHGHLGRHHGHLGGHHGGGDDEHGQPGGLITDNIDLGAKARAAHRSGKLFSVFSIVSFPNEACVSNMDQTNGTCLSPADCRTIGGALEGSCASGFGTCCVVRLGGTGAGGVCGGVVTANTTVLQNPGYPGKYSTAGTCVYLVKRMDEGVCQIRLDFQQLSVGYSSSSPTGCVSGTTDYISFTTPNQLSYPAVCGDMEGQHMYFDLGVTGDSLEIDIALVGSTTTRTWNILVTQLACTDPWRAPDDCLQYYTGSSGEFRSFNFANGQLLSSQAYRACFRQELDFCSISYRASLRPSDSFEMLTSNTGTTTTTANCKTAFISVPIGGDTGVKDSRAIRYCGSYFDSSEGSTRNGHVDSAVTPFEVFVFSDASPVTADKSSASGFHLVYQQKPCNGV